MAIVFLGTFLAVTLTLLSIWQHFFGRRRAADILRGRDPTDQRATSFRIPNLAQRWEQAAKQADLNWTARTYLGVVGGGLAVALLAILLGNIGAAVLILTAAVSAPWVIVRYRQNKRAEQFTRQLPGALTLMANTLRAGGTLLQAIRAVARQMPDPIKSEFGRIEQAMTLQVPLANALDQARQRIGVQHFASVVVAAKVAGQAGADMEGVLENIAAEIVEEDQFQDAMRAATSEGRMSARIVTVIPFLGIAFFLWNNPHYFDSMLQSSGGKLALLGSFLGIAIGWIVVSRMTDSRNW